MSSQSKRSDVGAIVWVVDHLPDRRQTGREARHLELIRALAEAGARITVWAEHGGDTGPSSRQLEALGVRWEAPPPDRRWAPGHVATLSDRLGDLLSRNWDRVVVAGPRNTAAVARLMGKRPSRAPVLTDLGSVRFPSAHKQVGVVDQNEPATGHLLAAIADADGVIAASGPDAAVVKSARPDRPVFVFEALGVGSSPERPPNSDGGLLFIGDLLHHPNLQAIEWWMEEVAARVQARVGRPLPLRIVGRGSGAYQRLWDRPDRVSVAGWQPDLDAEYSSARLLVIPLPFATGTGGRMAAALAAGTPVVASASATAVLGRGVRESVLTGEDPDQLADHIARMMTEDAAWMEQRRLIETIAIPARRRTQSSELAAWVAAAQPQDSPSGRRTSSRRFGSRTTPRLPIQSS